MTLIYGEIKAFWRLAHKSETESSMMQQTQNACSDIYDFSIKDLRTLALY